MLDELTIAELGRRYRSAELSPVEVVRAMLARIEQVDGLLNSYVTVTHDHALAQARQAEDEFRKGQFRGPLHGIPYAAKDLLYTRGIRTTVGSKILADFVPDHDAAVIERLNEAGAILIGKAGMHEWAYGITSNNPHFGAVRNPWNTDRIPGGSSGGSTAALAAGLCSFSLGSDTGGSIRIPASLCGLAGLKPTFGRVSRYGAYPLGHTLDTLGPFGLTVEDTARVYETISGVDPRDDSSVDRPVTTSEFPREPNLTGKKIGVPSSFFFDGLMPEVETSTKATLRVIADLGAELVDVEMPDMEAFNTLHRLILLAEGTSVHKRRLAERREDFGDDVGLLLDQGQFVLATDYLNAQRRRREICDHFNRLLRDVDAIVTPAIPITAALIGQLEVDVRGKSQNVRLATTRNIRALNLTGLPLLSVPCGFDSGGMPIGLQIIGRLFDESGVLEIGHAYESATEWHRQRPALD